MVLRRRMAFRVTALVKAIRSADFPCRIVPESCSYFADPLRIACWVAAWRYGAGPRAIWHAWFARSGRNRELSTAIAHERVLS